MAVYERPALPARPQAPNSVKSDYPMGMLEGLKVLVVDDEPDARELIKRVLLHGHAEVLLASSAREALDLLDRHRPDVLVSDIGMPEQDGYELIREVRSRGRTAQDVPAVALTAFARSEDRRRALMAGFQIHVAKPVDANELTAVVASLAGRTGGM
jgi:CheY-like chemotaxis protein